MNPENRNRGHQIFSTVLRAGQTFVANCWRRLLIGARYGVVLLFHLRLRRAWRQLGKKVHLALEAGEVNPLLTPEVKDSVQAAQELLTRKKAQLEAIQALRQRLRESRSPGSSGPEPAGSPPGDSATG